MSDTSSDISLSGVDVLLVDNDTNSLRILRRALESKGAKVRLAGNLAKAHQVIAQKLVHSMVVEASLKEGSGLELIRHFKSVFPSGSFFLMSTTTSDPS